MNITRLKRDEVFATLPPVWPNDVLPAVAHAVKGAQRSIVVLDDDPTGTQTVYDIPVLTTWDEATIAELFEAQTPLFYILTNSRSMVPSRAQAVAKEIGNNLHAASLRAKRQFSVISRSDSTLRGHYPTEVDPLLAALDKTHAVHLIAPFFEEGGRYTINDIHWVEEGDELVPAGDTPFAKDASFGYTASNLRHWVAEKTGNRIQADQVASLTLADIRQQGPAGVTRKLTSLPAGSVCIVNAATMRDLEVVALGCLQAEAAGQTLLYRTGASFVRAFAGLPKKPLLDAIDLALPSSGAGLVVVGSHVPKSTSQLAHLQANSTLVAIELNAQRLLDAKQGPAEIERVRLKLQQSLDAEQDTVLFTSRTLIKGTSAADSLQIAGVISQALVTLVSTLSKKPRYLVAKGGITSSDLATQGLHVKKMYVLGQVLPGVPANRLGDESRFPGLAYIVFPGNVGNEAALTTLVHQLSQA